MKPTFLLLFFLSSLLINAQESSNEVPFIAYWEKGDVYNYRITKVKEVFSSEEKNKKDSSTYHVRFEVIDSTESGYTIKWSTEYTLPDSINNPLSSEFIRYLIPDIVYTTDELGMYIEIINWEEVMEKYSALIKIGLASIKKEAKEVTDSLYNSVNNLFSNKAVLESLVSKEINLFHSPMGMAYSVDSIMMYESEIESAIGTPIKINGQLEILDVDVEMGYCSFSNTYELDPAGTQQFLAEFFNLLSVPNKEDMSSYIENATYELTENSYNEYYYDPGIPIFIKHTRNFQLKYLDNHTQSKETTILELID